MQRQQQYDRIIAWLKNNLNDERYRHSLGVANCAKELAEKYGEDPDKAYLAGLVHDCAKCLSKEENEKYLNIVKITDDEKINAKTWHAPIGEHLAKELFNISDSDILSSIRWHTLGKLEMTTFEKIIFLADKIETETRDKSWCEENQELLKQENGLNKSVLNCYKATIKSLCDRNLKICLDTIHIYNKLLEDVK